MWQMIILTRFKALQTFLSANERHHVKSALFEWHKMSLINAETTAEEICDETRTGESAHLERWTKWKLEDDKVYQLTSTTGLGTGGMLIELEASVANLRFFARGKRGVLYAGELRSNHDLVVAKVAADTSLAGLVTQEAQWLRVMNRMGIGARLLDAGIGWFLCERLEGKNVVEFLKQGNNVTTPANTLWILREMLCQCFAMDLMGINKEEMTHPHRHIIVHRSTQKPRQWQCTFIDFEKCSPTRKPKNVTQLCQFLSSPRLVALLITKGVKVNVRMLRQKTKHYKQNISSAAFGNIMRVFGL